ncbi:hypothetical protein [Haloprofundus salinisoli]|uniref:hypothetical protein n=1 Tax=Haloprofundus salinisoli TaxID=2876193 RepID=UPI001CCF157A|nr:hypothetical protein [Haloprofundus salinisoli]
MSLECPGLTTSVSEHSPTCRTGGRDPAKPQGRRRRTRPGRRVARREVLDHWLACEGLTPSGGSNGPPSRTEDAVDRLLRANPGAAAFLWRDAPIRWFHTHLSADELGRVRVIEGPENLLWNALSPDGTVEGAATRVVESDASRLSEETGVDVARIERLAEQLADASETLPDIVCVQRRPWERPSVADGNHRAVAAAVAAGRENRPERREEAVVRQGDTGQVGVYFGVGANRPFEDVQRASKAVWWAIRRRLVGESEPNAF